MVKKMLPEGYDPPVIFYNDAEYESKWDSNPVRMSSGSGGHMFMGGTYKINVKGATSGDSFLDVALVYHNMPDFCGGFLVHSPTTRVRQHLDQDFCARLNHAARDGMIELPGTKRYEDWEKYGYYLLARALARTMRDCTMNSAMMAGRVGADSETERLAAAWLTVTEVQHLRPWVDGVLKEKLLHVTGCNGEAYRQSVVTSRRTGPEYRNENSGNLVQWTDLHIDHSTTEGNYTILPVEVEYAKVATNWLRRRTWRNG